MSKIMNPVFSISNVCRVFLSNHLSSQHHQGPFLEELRNRLSLLRHHLLSYRSHHHGSFRQQLRNRLSLLRHHHLLHYHHRHHHLLHYHHRHHHLLHYHHRHHH